MGNLTAAQAADLYKAWLKTALRDEVLRRESRRLDEAANTAKRDALAAMESDLPAPGPA